MRESEREREEGGAYQPKRRQKLLVEVDLSKRGHGPVGVLQVDVLIGRVGIDARDVGVALDFVLVLEVVEHRAHKVRRTAVVLVSAVTTKLGNPKR